MSEERGHRYGGGVFAALLSNALQPAMVFFFL